MIKHKLTHYPNYQIKSFKEFHNDVLRKEEYYDENGRYNGMVRYWFDNGNLMFKLNYKNGMFNGIQRYYFENKKMYQRRTYKNNKLHGHVFEYYYSGKLKRKLKYNNDEAINVIAYDEDNGKVIPYISLQYKKPSYVHNCVHYFYYPSNI